MRFDVDDQDNRNTLIISPSTGMIEYHRRRQGYPNLGGIEAFSSFNL